MEPSSVQVRFLCDPSGRTVAAVVPVWGANVISLSYEPEDGLGAFPVLEQVDFGTFARRPTSYGIPLLGPTPGRVGRNQSGEFRLGDEDWRIDPTRHGFLRNVAWDVDEEATTEESLTLRVGVDHSGRGEIDGVSVFPFKFESVYELTVGPGRLHAVLTMTNVGDVHQPLNAGWHPYLHRGDRCRVHIPADSYWELYAGDAEPTPTGVLLPAQDDYGVEEGRVLGANEHFDDIFRCQGTDETRASVESNEHGARVTRFVAFDPGGSNAEPIRDMQLYTPPERQSICLEPLSCVPNALGLDAKTKQPTGLRIVPPGESVRFAVTVGIEIGTN